MIRRPPRSTLDRSSAASDVYKRQDRCIETRVLRGSSCGRSSRPLSLIHISEPTRQAEISYAVFCLKKKKKSKNKKAGDYNKITDKKDNIKPVTKKKSQ